ncbi:MAG: HprK-related kinase A [Magnetococcales bacterium]|nr:HprK-related kinase A [Magnetococcales bacterium]
MKALSPFAGLAVAEIDRRLAGPGLRWRSGPFVIQLRARNIPRLGEQLAFLYAAHPVIDPPWEEVADTHLDLIRSGGWRRWWRAQAIMEEDGARPLQPFPLDHALPLFEWGWNFIIASRGNRYLMLHTAALSPDGERALILPGLPGSGKSTLAAALALRGWRLLSDEFALVRPEDGRVMPLARPVALKNSSIGVIRDFDPKAEFGPLFPKTRKGTVAHLKPPPASVAAMDRSCRPAWVVAPRFESGAGASLQPMAPEAAFLMIAANAFNYEVQGELGFQAVARIVRNCTIHTLTFGDLSEAVALLAELVAS